MARAVPALRLAAVVALAGCLAPAGSLPPPDGDPSVPRPAWVEHHGCALDIAFFGLPIDDVRDRLPAGFEPAVVEDALGRESARSFVTGYACERAVVDGVEADGGVVELALALGVAPPAGREGGASSHWIAYYLSGDDRVASAYEAWRLGGAGEVTQSVIGASETGERATRAVTDAGVHAFTSRNTVNVVELGRDVLRFYAPEENGTMNVIDLVVEATRGGTGLASYESDDASFYPATGVEGQGFSEAWTGLAWTFTLVDENARMPAAR